MSPVVTLQPPDPHLDTPRWQIVAPGLYWDLLGRRLRRARKDGSPPLDPPRRPPPTSHFVTKLIRQRQRRAWSLAKREEVT